MIADASSADTLPPDAVFHRADSAIDAEVGGLTVMLDVEAGSYFGLNETATHIWALLAEPQSVGAIAADLPAHFEVDADQALTATRAFLADLAARGLIERVEA